MKVNRNSWHYRLWRWGRDDRYSHKRSEPRDLCRYFWHIAIVKMLLPLIGASLIVAGIVAIVIKAANDPLTVGLVILAILGGLAVAFGLAEFFDRRADLRQRREWDPSLRKEPGIVRQYLRARKRRICPLIEVVDEEA